MQQILGVESEMQVKESGIQVPLTNNPESMAWNPETKTVLDSLAWGNTVACVAGTGILAGEKRKFEDARARGGKERAPPLAFACSLRAAFKKN